jgi:hypothetical protein
MDMMLNYIFIIALLLIIAPVLHILSIIFIHICMLRIRNINLGNINN